MMMVTVPLAVLIGAAIGMLLGGYVVASGNNETGEYIVGTLFCCALFILVCCGLEALTKAGGA